jgi:hypothetical protein
VHPIGGLSRSEGDDGMGILDGLFGPKHPPLPETDPAVLRLGDAGEEFESFVAKANDKLEVVTGEGPIYLFVGKPPKAFGVVWFDNGERHDVRSMMDSGTLTPQVAGQLARDFGDIYVSHSTDDRYSYAIAGHAVTVTPSPELHNELSQAVERSRTA